MSDIDPLDDLIMRLERAAEQLRSGELSADAAAGMVEDCAAVATQAGAELERRARAESPRAPASQLVIDGAAGDDGGGASGGESSASEPASPSPGQG